ncbi:hypothetical protein [Streptomyces sp. TLI_171]|uniref:hypothetical protein n=1 Tax=Streptomyces sp. TLI_171 TaxID=1938859 RepID=UPI000C17CF93|nr:hypothetical protein [Streptomyces sp. TLI_171]RKE19170.1 hypothetical protein BX266_2481 [Streptomyces sp. TLI_171]
MSLLSTLARLEAVRGQRAEPLATVRHRHLSERPMVLVPLAAAGEAGAPLAVLLGTDRERPRLHFVPQPLNRTQRSEFLAAVAAEVVPYLESFGAEVELLEGSEKDPVSGEKVPVVRELCADAPQLIVPNAGGVAHLALLGRSTRFRRTAQDPDPGEYPAPTQVPLLGRWLTHLTDRAQVPGSSMLLAMTGLLSRHWATGQSNLEDQHLAARLAWHVPPAGFGPGTSGAAAAEWVESARDADGQLAHPPAGPTTDPRFDEQVLAPAILRHDAAVAVRERAEASRDAAEARRAAALVEQARAVLGEALLGATLPTWHDVWLGIDLLRGLPPAGHLPDRWEGDRWSFTMHRDRVAAGEPPQPRRDDAVTAARKLAQREREQAKLDIQEALDDPLAMAERRLSGEAFAGEVVDVVPEWSEGRSAKPRPLLVVRTGDRPHADPGREVYRAHAEPAQRAVIVSSAPGEVVVRLLSGMGRKKDPEPGSVPEPGDAVVFTLFELAARQSAPLPEPADTPWTHGGPPVAGADSPAGADEWE